MGFWKSLLRFLRFSKCEANILIIGLDNSGKSSVIQRLKSGNQSTTTDGIVPTIGLQTEIIKCIETFELK